MRTRRLWLCDAPLGCWADLSGLSVSNPAKLWAAEDSLRACPIRERMIPPRSGLFVKGLCGIRPARPVSNGRMQGSVPLWEYEYAETFSSEIDATMMLTNTDGESRTK